MDQWPPGGGPFVPTWQWFVTPRPRRPFSHQLHQSLTLVSHQYFPTSHTAMHVNTIPQSVSGLALPESIRVVTVNM
jgi:hypothetical protein